MSSFASRRRNTPWIHRWSRQIIGAIAGLGILNTAYLTITKLTNTVTACPTDGCEKVLESPYATLFGVVPLSLVGLIAYIGIATLALGPLAIKPEDNKPLRTKLDNITWFLLFVGTLAMTVFSGYLMYIMVSQFVAKFGPEGVCYFCLASALFAVSMFVLTLVGRAWEDVGQLLFTGVIVAMVTLVGTLWVFSAVTPESTQVQSTPGLGETPPVTTTSSQAEIELAKHLKQTGAKMYGAYWCSHCYEEKLVFGQPAVADLPYIECAPDGKNSQTAACKEAGVRAFPTWIVNGKTYEGTQTPQQLAEYSNYQGPKTFKNSPQ